MSKKARKARKKAKAQAKKARKAQAQAKAQAAEPLGYFQHDGEQMPYSDAQIDRLYTPGFAARLRAKVNEHKAEG